MSNDKRLDEVIRVKKESRNFVLLDKGFLEDDRLSFKAKGILAYLLSKPDDWKVIVGNLVNYSSDGKSAIYAGLKELKECGYYEKVPVRNESGTRIVRWESTVYEVPQNAESKREDSGNTLLSNFQEVDNLKQDNQFQENRERNNNYNTKNNYSKNNIMSSLSERDRLTKITDVEAVIKENIAYEDFKIAYPRDMELIDEFVSIMVDAVLSKSKYVRVDGEDKPRELIKSAMMKLKYFHIEYVLSQFKSYDKQIKKKKQYILSMLYHSSMELEIGVTNEVHVDFGYYY